jgi:hypothetical protein
VTDSSGAVYLTGQSSSDDFPTVNAYDSTYSGGAMDVVVAKLSPEGNALLYSTYLGGSDYDWGNDIAVDFSGAAYVTGETWSSNFPILSAFDAIYDGEGDAFVTKLNPSGSALAYSTFLGGGNGDYAFGIVVDPAGAAFVTGSTGSGGFPTYLAYDPNFNGGADVFVTKVDPAGNTLAFSTFIGSSGSERGTEIARDSTGAIYIAGYTTSSGFPTQNAYDASFNGDVDVFVTKLNAAGDTLVYSTFLGGSDDDRAVGMAERSGEVYIVGDTQSGWPQPFPTVSAYDATYNGNRDTFGTKLNRAGTALVYSTFLGGTSQEYAGGIAVDSAGAAYVTGRTLSLFFPTVNAFDPKYNGGGPDAFVSKLQ